MTRPVRIEVEAAGQLGHVFASRRPSDDGPAAPAVVLIHGIGVSHRYLRRLHRFLAQSADTYSIDLPGFGGTPTPAHTLTAAEQARYVLGAMEELGVPEFVVVGHSMGAQFAVETALQQPSRVPHVVLMGPVVNDRRSSVAQQALDLGRDCLFYESPSSNALVVTDYFRCGPLWYLKNLRVMMEYRIEERIGAVAAPVLVIRGGNDPVAPLDWCRRLAARAAAAEVVEIEGTGHVVQHNRAAQVCEAILAFAGIAAAGTEPQDSAA